MRSIQGRPTLRNLFAVCAAGWLLGACEHSSSKDDDDAPEPCEYADDGECDEPEGTGLCDEEMDRVDCAAGGARCRYVNDGFCDEPEGSGDCVEGSDRLDCARTQSCPFINDGFCDEPENAGDCADGTDVNDCRNPSGHTCPFLNDGTCDEPEGTSACAEGTDTSDCSGSPFSCATTNNGVCNEPGGTNTCRLGTDTADCMFTSACASTNNGVCNEPEGTNTCPDGTDTTDCTLLACGATACPPVVIAGLDLPGSFSLGCCTTEERCGISMSGGCLELQEPQPGDCPSYDLGGSPAPLVGCCLTNGMCGLIFPAGSTDYCVEVSDTSSSPLGPFLPITPTPCGGLDNDAGIE